jgi:hypothetical protein
VAKQGPKSDWTGDVGNSLNRSLSKQNRSLGALTHDWTFWTFPQCEAHLAMLEKRPA